MSTATGTLSSVGDTVVLTGNGEMTAMCAVYGTFTGVGIAIDVSPDGSNWFTIAVVDAATGLKTSSITSLSAAAMYVAASNGMQCRVRLTAISTGSVSVRITGVAVPIGAVVPTPVEQTTGLSNGAPALALNAATADGNGTAIDYTTSRRTFGMQYILAGDVNFTGGTVNLQGSLDGTNYFTIATLTIGTDASGKIVFAVDKPARYVRVNAASLAGGTNPTVSAYVVAVG